MNNFKTTLLTAVTGLTVATAGLFALPAVEAEARTVTGNLAGFRGVTAVDNGYGATDTLYVPFTDGTGVVNVNCATGDYSWNNSIGKPSALALSLAWCGN